MIYSKLYLTKNKPSIFLIGAAVFVLFLTASVFYFKPKGEQRIQTAQKLIKMEIVNLSPNQFGVYWETKKKEKSWIVFKSKNGSQKIIDERDVESSMQKYIHHYALVKNIQPDSIYSFQIVGESSVFSNEKNQITYTVKTPFKPMTISSVKPAYGKTILPNGSSKENLMVRLQIEGRSPLFTLTKSTGEWLIPLHYVVETATGKITTVDERKNATIQIWDEEGQMTTANLAYYRLNSIGRTFILGASYDLLASEGGTVLGVATEADENDQKAISIIYPRENAIIPAQRPLIKGRGIANTEVFASVNSKPAVSFRTVVDARGEWRILPSASIPAGRYELSVTAQNERGAKVVLKRTFVIAKNGEQVLGIATAEPTITNMPTPTVPLPTSSPVLTIGPSLQPTIMPSPTISYTLPTISPSPLPESGFNLQLPLILSIGLLILGGGFLLVF